MNRYANTCQILEQFARARGLQIVIVSHDCNAHGRYFVVREDGAQLRDWRPLGWTRRQAEQSIREMIAINQMAEEIENV